MYGLNGLQQSERSRQWAGFEVPLVRGKSNSDRRQNGSASPSVRVPIGSDADIIVARQHGRALAIAMDFSTTDSAFIATTVSELARALLSHTVRGEIWLHTVYEDERSGVVIVAGVVILSTGWTIADPIAGALIALFLLPRTWALLRQTVNILLEGAPAHLDVTEIEEALCSAPSVRRVHDLHVWTLTSGREAMSAHVVVEPGAPSDKILEELHIVLHARFGIDHTTIQIETEPAPLIQITPKAG